MSNCKLPIHTFQPVGANILVSQEAHTDTFVPDGVIVTPDINKTRPLCGIVEAVSKDVEMPVEVGDRVLFEQYAGKVVSLDGEQYLIMAIGSIYGIVGKDVKVAVR